jgi:hypothetical protein
MIRDVGRPHASQVWVGDISPSKEVQMAVVRSLREASGSYNRRHPSEVDCDWAEVVTDSGVLLQLATYGSDKRKIPGKTSQTLQLERTRALELRDVIERVFPE